MRELGDYGDTTPESDSVICPSSPPGPPQSHLSGCFSFRPMTIFVSLYFTGLLGNHLTRPVQYIGETQSFRSKYFTPLIGEGMGDVSDFVKGIRENSRLYIVIYFGLFSLPERLVER